MWARAPKTEITSIAAVRSAACLATIIFNSGRQALIPVLECLGVQAGPLCTSHLAHEDAFRIRGSRKKVGQVVKKRRKSLRQGEKRAEEAHIDEEGMTYGSGSF